MVEGLASIRSAMPDRGALVAVFEEDDNSRCVVVLMDGSMAASWNGGRLNIHDHDAGWNDTFNRRASGLSPASDPGFNRGVLPASAETGSSLDAFAGRLGPALVLAMHKVASGRCHGSMELRGATAGETDGVAWIDFEYADTGTVLREQTVRVVSEGPATGLVLRTENRLYLTDPWTQTFETLEGGPAWFSSFNRGEPAADRVYFFADIETLTPELFLELEERLRLRLNASSLSVGTVRPRWADPRYTGAEWDPVRGVVRRGSGEGTGEGPTSEGESSGVEETGETVTPPPPPGWSGGASGSVRFDDAWRPSAADPISPGARIGGGMQRWLLTGGGLALIVGGAVVLVVRRIRG